MTALQISKLREDFIESRTELLNKRVSAAERKLLDVLISRIVDEFEKTDGRINPSIKNIELVSKIDKVWSEFQKGEYVKIIQQFGGDLSQLQDYNSSYYKIIETDQTKVAKVSKDVKSIMSRRIGIGSEGEVVKNGFLDKLIKDNTLLNKIKKETYKSVTSGVSLKDYLKRSSDLIVGNANVSGGLQKHFNTFAYDTYSQFTSTSNNLFASKLGIKAFIYAGGLIKTSRLFCEKHNGKVYTTDEAQQWESMIGDDDGPMWAESNYQPLEDRGGHRCRHQLNYISNTEAVRRRPELSSVLD